MNKIKIGLILLTSLLILSNITYADFQLNTSTTANVIQLGSNTITINAKGVQTQPLLINFIAMFAGLGLLCIYTQENKDILFKFIWLISGLSFIEGGFLLGSIPELITLGQMFGSVYFAIFTIVMYRLIMNLRKHH
jgi:hypothetical protein